MSGFDLVCLWIAELLPLVASLTAFLYGIIKFFKKKMPLFLQSITMANGCYALGSIYHLCQTLTIGELVEGFTPAYLGRIGFFLFFIVASYGQMDRIIDDGTKNYRPYRYIALLGPLVGLILFIPNLFVEESLISTHISYVLVWIPALICLYFNLKHAVFPNHDFGFIKAIKPYNILAVGLVISELSFLIAWNYYEGIGLLITSVIFSILTIITIIVAGKGVKKWTI